MHIQSALYNGHEIIKSNHAPAVVHDLEDTLEIVEITRKRMLEKVKIPLCDEKKVKFTPPDYSKENYLATFTPHRHLTSEQIFWSSDIAKITLKPISAMTVYPPNTPARLVPKEKRSEADLIFDFKALDSQSTELTEKVTTLQEQSELFRAENAKINWHYKELYDSIKITHAKTIEKKTSLLTKNENLKVIQIFLWDLNSGCSKHMMGNRSRLKNFVRRFNGTVKFMNDHFGTIMGYEDYVISDCAISRVYYVEGLRHNLFFVGQFCDSYLEVAFGKHSCYVKDVDSVELLKGNRGSNVYTISVKDMMKSSLICLLSKASKNKSWLWHRRLNHLNFNTINDLARNDLVRGLPRLKFEKDHLCITPLDGPWTKYVSGGMTLLNISSTKHKERPLRVRLKINIVA
nr:integrase, catalytic region, zinc finger, CCHC-type, peptidase aspartic, catalytic [Tanacetum cinerariifolium]